MKAKLITLAIGAAILGTGTAAMARDWNDRHDDGWRGHQWRRHEWREHQRPYWHRDWYHYEPRYERRYVPVPVVPAPRYGAYPYGYDRDGVSIILRGHIN